jgi:hypothetical protein
MNRVLLGVKRRARIAMGVMSVGASVAGERLLRLQPREPGRLPQTLTSIDANWLTQVLCKALPGVRVTTVTDHGGSDGTTSRRRFALEYEGNSAIAELPTHIFVKLMQSFHTRLQLGLSGIAESEARFYRELRPELSVETPSAYFARAQERGWRSVIVLEDVGRTSSATFLNPSIETSIGQVDNMLTNLANFHGKYWQSPRFLGDLAWLRTPTAFLRNLCDYVGMESRSIEGIRRATDVVPRGLQQRSAQTWRAMLRVVEAAEADPRTLIHGDSHLANHYLTGSGRVGICDWQLCMQGHWAWDVATTITTSLSIANRRSWERQLLGLYCDRLAAAGGPRLDGESAWNQYRRLALFPYFAWAYTFGHGALQPHFQPDNLARELLARTAQAVEDLESVDAS